ncbi:MAG: hypothetical protein LiPW15_478 [Parcubacteria group bacterium LiPW_15]|nr:MAG: hypothetical protein LiPW15_478 [Parcubacteria group bacterium LiPW_15]
MQTVNKLIDVKPWCLNAKPGDARVFSVREEVTQETASAFIHKVNQERGRINNVWVVVESFACAPEPTTRIRVHCSR